MSRVYIDFYDFEITPISSFFKIKEFRKIGQIGKKNGSKNPKIYANLSFLRNGFSVYTYDGILFFLLVDSAYQNRPTVTLNFSRPILAKYVNTMNWVI